jgi:hypothetical protein
MVQATQLPRSGERTSGAFSKASNFLIFEKQPAPHDRRANARRRHAGTIRQIGLKSAVFLIDVGLHCMTLALKKSIGAPRHSITSSAIAISDCGMARLSVLAVLRLITSSYLVGASTGKLAGFSPFRTGCALCAKSGLMHRSNFVVIQSPRQRIMQFVFW